MKSYFEITKLPKNFSKLAIAAWRALQDYALYEVDGKLIFTDWIEEYLNPTEGNNHCTHEFDSFAALESWLLGCISEWCTDCPEMIEEIESHLTLK